MTVCRPEPGLLCHVTEQAINDNDMPNYKASQGKECEGLKEKSQHFMTDDISLRFNELLIFKFFLTFLELYAFLN